MISILINYIAILKLRREVSYSVLLAFTKAGLIIIYYHLWIGNYLYRYIVRKTRLDSERSDCRENFVDGNFGLRGDQK